MITKWFLERNGDSSMKQGLKRVFSVVLSMLLVFTAVNWPNSTNAAASTTSQPTLSKPVKAYENTYLIYNASELYWYAALVNGTLTDGTAKDRTASASLQADITLNTNVLKSNGTLNGDGSNFIEWTPISSGYTGSFNGNGHTISGVYVNSDQDYQGFFGSVSLDQYKTLEIKNLTIKDSYVKGNNNTGGLVGCIQGSKGYNYVIDNCGFEGTVIGNKYTGGLLGMMYRITLSDSYSNGNVIGGSCVGGVAGHGFGISVTNCYSAAKVSGSSTVGDMTGASSYCSYSNCYYLAWSDEEYGLGSYSGSTVPIAKTKTQFNSGEVAYLLNGSTSLGTLTWGQRIGTNNFPVFWYTRSTVYSSGSSYYNCK